MSGESKPTSIAQHAWSGYQHRFAGNATRAEPEADVGEPEPVLDRS